MNDPAYYTANSPDLIKKNADALAELEARIEAAYARWDELEAKKALVEAQE